MSKRKATAMPKYTKTKRRKTGGPAGGVMIIPRNLTFQRNTVGLGPEKKNCDVQYNNAVPGASVNTWTLAAGGLLNSVPQNGTETGRIGRKLQMKSIDLIYTVGLTPTSTGGGCFRIKVVYDKQPNGALPAVLDVLALDDFGAKNNLANSDRFITLIDEMTDTVGVGTNYSTSNRIYRKLGLDAMFTGTGGAIANITTGSIFVMVAQNGYINTQAPLFEIDSRIKFIDI